jgi:Gpi18-like mannosyltransferase
VPTKTLPGLVRRSPPSAYWRSIVVATAVTTTAIKILVASRTFGTNDVHYWIDFARGVREFRIIGIYGRPLLAPYNHPPLAGVPLAAINYLVDHGLGNVPLLIRVPAAVADVVTALLVFELVRQAHPPRTAGLAAVMVAASPVLMTVSGFHGITDPVFVMLALLALYLIVVRGWAAAAGAALATAISIKLVPVVLIPALLVLVARSGWRGLVRFGAGGAAVMVPLWGPVLLAWSEFSRNVLSYPGVALREWGLPQFLEWAQVRASGSTSSSDPADPWCC